LYDYETTALIKIIDSVKEGHKRAKKLKLIRYFIQPIPMKKFEVFNYGIFTTNEFTNRFPLFPSQLINRAESLEIGQSVTFEHLHEGLEYSYNFTRII
jgi:hypothetical protein